MEKGNRKINENMKMKHYPYRERDGWECIKGPFKEREGKVNSMLLFCFGVTVERLYNGYFGWFGFY